MRSKVPREAVLTECSYTVVWIVATFPGGAHFSRSCRLEEYAPPGNIAIIYTDFLLHTTHCPCEFHLGYAL